MVSISMIVPCSMVGLDVISQLVISSLPLFIFLSSSLSSRIRYPPPIRIVLQLEHLQPIKHV